MVVAERNDLTLIKILISNDHIHLELFENSEGNLFLSSRSNKPQGTIYFATTPSLVHMFLDGEINLQVLFDKVIDFKNNILAYIIQY